MIQTTWDKQESGWYTHPKLGDIHNVYGEWWWRPKIGRIIESKFLLIAKEIRWFADGASIGPFDTLFEAKDAAGRAPLYDSARA